MKKWGIFGSGIFALIGLFSSFLMSTTLIKNTSDTEAGGPAPTPYAEPASEFIDAYTKQNGFTAPVTGIEAGSWVASSNTLVANALISDITTACFNIAAEGAANGGVLSSYTFLDIDLDNVTNLTTSSSVSIQNCNNGFANELTASLILNNAPQSYDISSLPVNAQNIRLQFHLEHSSNDFAAINYYKLGAKTTGLYNLSILPSTTTMSAGSLVDFTVNLSVNNSELRNANLILDMDRLNGWNNLTSSAPTPLVTDAKQLNPNTGNYVRGVPAEFVSATEANGVTINTSPLTASATATPSRTFQKAVGYAYWPLGSLSAGTSLTTQFTLKIPAGYVHQATLQGAIRLEFGDVERVDIPAVQARTIDEKLTAPITVTSSPSVMGYMFSPYTNISNTSEYSNFFLTDFSVRTPQNNQQLLNTSDFLNIDFDVQLDLGTCTPGVASVTVPGYGNILVPMNPAPTSGSASALIGNTYKYRLVRVSSQLDLQGIRIFVDMTRSTKTASPGTPCTVGTTTANSDTVIFKTTVNFGTPSGITPLVISNDSVSRPNVGSTLAPKYLIQSVNLPTNSLLMRAGDENNNQTRGILGQTWPGFNEFYFSGNIEGVPANKGYSRGGEFIVVQTRSGDAANHTVTLEHVLRIQQIEDGSEFRGVHNNLVQPPDAVYKSCEASVILPSDPLFPHPPDGSAYSSTALLTQGWYPVNKNLIPLNNSASMSDPDARVTAQLNGNRCYLLTIKNNVAPGSLSNHSLLFATTNDVPDGTEIIMAHLSTYVINGGVVVSTSGPATSQKYIKHNNISRPSLRATSNSATVPAGGIASVMIQPENHNSASKSPVAKYVINLNDSVTKSMVDFTRQSEFSYTIVNPTNNPSGTSVTGETLHLPSANCDLSTTNQDDQSCMMSVEIPQQYQPQNGWGFNRGINEHNDYQPTFFIQFNIPLKQSIPVGTTINFTGEVRGVSNNMLGADNSEPNTSYWPTSYYTSSSAITIGVAYAASASKSAPSTALPGATVNNIFAVKNTGNSPNNGIYVVDTLPRAGVSAAPGKTSDVTPALNKLFVRLLDQNNNAVTTGTTQYEVMYSTNSNCRTAAYNPAYYTLLASNTTTESGYDREIDLSSFSSTAHCLLLKLAENSSNQLLPQYTLEGKLRLSIPAQAQLETALYNTAFSAAETVTGFGSPVTLPPTFTRVYKTAITQKMPPVASNDTVGIKKDTVTTLPLSTLLNNDTDADGINDIVPSSLRWFVSGNPVNPAGTIVNTAHASLALNTGLLEFTYSPVVGYTGNDSIQYIIADTDGFESNPATITFTIDPVYTCDYQTSTSAPNCDAPVTCDYIVGNTVPDCSTPTPPDDDIPGNTIPDPEIICDWITGNNIPDCVDNTNPYPSTTPPNCDLIRDNGYPDCPVGSTGDTDGDGVSDVIENNGPNNGDNDKDGVKDAYQSNVVTLISSGTSQYMSIISRDSCAAFSNVASNPTQHFGSGDRGYEYPYGLVSFEVPCSIITLTIQWNTPTNNKNLVVRKFGPTIPGDSSSTAFYSLDAVISYSADSTSVTYTLQDGFKGDNSGIDGIIKDPVGLALPTTHLPTTGANTYKLTFAALSFLLIVALVIFIRVNSLNSQSKI